MPILCFGGKMEEKVSIKEKLLNSIKGLTFKTYISSTVSFAKENLIKTIWILGVIVLVILASLLIKPQILKMEIANVTFLANYIEAIKVVVIMIFAGIAPYLYAPVIGFVYGIYLDVICMANLILEVGYLKGILMYIIPFVLNSLIIITATALGLYICKNITLGYRITNVKSTNSMDLRISIYEATGKKDKKNKLEKERQEKIKKLENKKKELDLFQIINVTAILCVIQAVSSLAKALVI